MSTSIIPFSYLITGWGSYSVIAMLFAGKELSSASFSSSMGGNYVAVSISKFLNLLIKDSDLVAETLVLVEWTVVLEFLQIVLNFWVLLTEDIWVWF